MNNIEKIEPTGLFTNYIFKAIPLAFDESLSYYETLCALLDYVKNTVIPTVNNNADAVSELQTLYIELKNYVDNYFNNLDVQEEINNKLDEMVEDGTFETLIASYISQLKYIRVSDYYEENSYIDLPTLYNIAQQQNKSIYIDGTYKVKDNKMIINDYIEVFGGKLIVDSFESTNNDTFDVFYCYAPCYIHDIEITSIADRIPSINRHAGVEYGYASNVKVAEVRSSNCTFERIKGDFISGIGIYHATDILTNIKIDKCYFNHCELGMFCERGEFNCTNSTFIQSTDVQSIYYHPFYLAFARNSNIDNIEIGNNALVHPNANLTSYILPDIIHLYNARYNYENDSYNVNISNINVRGSGFYKFSQLRFAHDINFTNINASLQKFLIELGTRYKNIKFNNCNINTINPDNGARTVFIGASATLTNDDNIELNNCTFTYENNGSQYFMACNLTLNNCKILSPNSNVTLPVNNDLTGYLKFNNCYIKLSRLMNLYIGSGLIEYNNCYFDNSDVNNYINSGIDAVLNVKVINCYIKTLKNMFETEKINSNTCFNVYGKNPDTGIYTSITNFTPRALS